MNIDQKIWFKGLVEDYKKESKTRNIIVDKEHEKAFLELLKNTYNNVDEKSGKEIIRFIIKQHIVRPFVKQIIENYIKGKMLNERESISKTS